MTASQSDAAPRIFSPEYYARMGALEAGSWWNAAMRNAAERLLRAAKLPAAGSALDVGCGTGHTMAWLRGVLPGWQLSGIDVAVDGLAWASQMGEQVAQASALEIPCRSASQDLIVTLDVLQHLPHPSGDVVAMSELRRVLKPSGYLLVRTNAQAFPHTPDDPAAMFRKYRTADLRSKLARSGLTPIRLSRVNALLGLAEIPRELRATRATGSAGYHGLLAEPKTPGPVDRLKRWWLEREGAAVAAGMTLPLGRTILALCRAAPSPPDVGGHV